MTSYVIVWIVASVAVGLYASGRGRGSGNWFLIALVLSPLLALLLCAASKNLKADAEKPSDLTHARCPACAEYVLPTANTCKHCGGKLVPDHGFTARIAGEQRQAAAKKNLIAGIVLVGLVIGAYLLAR